MVKLVTTSIHPFLWQNEHVPEIMSAKAFMMFIVTENTGISAHLAPLIQASPEDHVFTSETDIKKIIGGGKLFLVSTVLFQIK